MQEVVGICVCEGGVVFGREMGQCGYQGLHCSALPSPPLPSPPFPSSPFPCLVLKAWHWCETHTVHHSPKRVTKDGCYCIELSVPL